jgi:hypothetical protein
MPLRSALLSAGVLGILLVAHVGAQPPWVRPPGKTSWDFQGYWMGVDPVDGGDARRSLVKLDGERYALAARDTVFSLCDGTEHGFGSFDDGVVTAPNVMQSNNLTLQCFNNGASVTLHVTFELLADGLMAEIATRADGTPVSTILFHRVS